MIESLEDFGNRWRNRALEAELEIERLRADLASAETTVQRVQAYAESRCTEEHANFASASWVLHLIEDPTANPTEE